MLSLDWYCQTPLDFEHKNYLLLQYLKIVDDSFSVKVLSPYLLHTERLVKELKEFAHKSQLLENHLRRDIESIDLLNWKIIRKEIQKNDEIKVVFEVVDYSTPLLESKITLGYKLLDKYPQVLF
jgi:hypothetical protein